MHFEKNHGANRTLETIDNSPARTTGKLELRSSSLSFFRSFFGTLLAHVLVVDIGYRLGLERVARGKLAARFDIKIGAAAGVNIDGDFAHRWSHDRQYFWLVDDAEIGILSSLSSFVVGGRVKESDGEHMDWMSFVCIIQTLKKLLDQYHPSRRGFYSYERTGTGECLEDGEKRTAGV
jgi:hypothetical protein